MNPERIRQTLSAARPHGQDEDDPQVARARRAVKDDPAACARLESLRQRDAEIAAALRATAVPDGLLASLHAAAAAPIRERAPRTPGRWLRIGGIAAAVLLVGALAFRQLWWLPQVRFDRTTDFRAAMAYYISEVPFRLDFTSPHLGAIEQWLDNTSIPPVPDLPPALGRRVPLGCKQVRWGEVNVSLICFYDSIPEQRIIHLFVAPRDALSEEAIAEIEASLMTQGLDTRGWKTESWVCVLVPSHPDMEVSPLLDEAPFAQSA